MLFSSDTDQPIHLSGASKVEFNGADRRLEHRRRILKGAILRFNNGFGNLECVIRNLTSNGARISMGQTNGIPSRLQLQISGERTPIEALVRWRTPRDIGLSFLLRAE